MASRAIGWLVSSVVFLIIYVLPIIVLGGAFFLLPSPNGDPNIIVVLIVAFTIVQLLLVAAWRIRRSPRLIIRQTVIYLIVGGVNSIITYQYGHREEGVLFLVLQSAFLFAAGCTLPATLILLYTGKWKTPLPPAGDDNRQEVSDSTPVSE